MRGSTADFFRRVAADRLRGVVMTAPWIGI
jgi:hypothetical protein